MKMIGIFILLLLFMMTLSQDRKIKIEFEDGNIHKWGMYEHNVPDKPWKIRIIYMEDGQAREKGVEEGWKILNINNEDITEENHEKFRSIFKKETACTMTFEKTELNTLHQALIKDKPAEEIKQIMQDFKTQKGENWLTEKIIEEIDSVQWISTFTTITEQIHLNDQNIFEIILNFLEKKPLELKEYIIKNEAVLHLLTYDDDSTTRLELLMNTFEKQGENIENYLLSDIFPLVNVFKNKNEKFMDFVIQKISSKKLIARVFNDPKNLFNKFAIPHTIAFKKLVQIALEIGEQNALIEKIESDDDMLHMTDWCEDNEDMYKIFIEKIYEGKDDELIKYFQKNNSSAIFQAIITKKKSAFKFYMNFLKNYDTQNGTKLLITEVTKKNPTFKNLFVISTFDIDLFLLMEDLIPHETFKEILFDPETENNYIGILILYNHLDFLTRWFKIAERDEEYKNYFLNFFIQKDYLINTIEKDFNEMSILILNFYENFYRNDSSTMVNKNFEKMLTKNLMMSLRAKQLDVSLKLMQTMISLNCKVLGSPFKINENIIYESLYSMMDKKLYQHDIEKKTQLTVENIKYFLTDKEQEKCTKKIKEQMQTKIQNFLQDHQQEIFKTTINKNEIELELENFQILIKAIVDHAKGLKALIQTVDFIKNRYTKNGIYGLKI